MFIKQIMTPDAKVIDSNASVKEAAQKMKTMDVGAVPVMEDNHLIGILTDRDITLRLVAEGLNPGETPVRAILSANVCTCYEDEDVKYAATLMRARQIRRLVVLDHDEKISGILSLGDLAVDRNEQKLAEEVLQDVSMPAGSAFMNIKRKDLK